MEQEHDEQTKSREYYIAAHQRHENRMSFHFSSNLMCNQIITYSQGWIYNCGVTWAIEMWGPLSITTNLCCDNCFSVVLPYNN
jgi:hypothetical protein